ncbi:maltose O-acetyltransferase [Streptomyces sp. BK208]|nr:maltose O-acetyltransferase [Streptomyces sp. BK208]
MTGVNGAPLPAIPAARPVSRCGYRADRSNRATDTSVRSYARQGTIARMPTDHFAGDSRTNLERMLAGDLYVADDPEIARRQQQAVRLAARYQTAYAEDAETARPLLDELLGSLGAEAHVRPPLYVDYGSNITVGARTFVNYNLTALDVAAITIGEDCQIGPNVQLLTPTHPLEPGPRRDKLEAARPIVIGDNVWLGGGAIVLPGVTIGDNAVIGAGAVVTKDVPANVVAVGNPARPVRNL